MREPLDTREDVLAAFDVSRETTERLDAILETLDDWRTRVNLIGPREWPVIWSRHVADSLQLADLVGAPLDLVDLGSGAGFPGLVLAAALGDNTKVTLIESVGKKCAFLRAASETAGLNVQVTQSRIEAAPVSPAEIVTARALSALPKLLEYAAPWTENGAICVFPKGESAEEELTLARRAWSFHVESVPSRTSPTGRILKLSEVRRCET
ncbi:MAG: 16S rRNA (guanine(527)-N(7))-methyltransferase RsmG [Pseudomonadota bacterium]